jgi:hypothetical protein
VAGGYVAGGREERKRGREEGWLVAGGWWLVKIYAQTKDFTVKSLVWASLGIEIRPNR